MKPDPDQLRHMYLDLEMTTAQIGELLLVCSQTVQKWLHKHRIPLRTRGYRRGVEHRGWKGGRTIDKSGYVLVHQPSHPAANSAGYVREHRLVMEQTLGRPLLPSEVVHHKDGNVSNNDPGNLQLYPSNGDHLADELHGRCPDWSPAGLAKLRKTSIRKRGVSNDAEAVRLYAGGRSAPEIARQLDCSAQSVRSAVRRSGVRIRSNSEAQSKNTLPPDEELVRLFHQMDIRALTKAIHVDAPRIYRRLAVLGIQPRPRGMRGARLLQTPPAPTPTGQLQK